jgi:hypothetical protein
MAQFDDRERGEEARYALTAEMAFKAEARRNKLLGLWAASLLGESGEAAAAYARDVVAADFEEIGGGAVRKVTADLEARGVAVPAAELRAKIDQLSAQAILQVKAGK